MVKAGARLISVAALAVLFPGCFAPPPGDAPLRYRDQLPGVTVSVTRDIVYSTAQDGVPNELRLDLYRPTPDTVTQRPLAVFVHGGGFRGGTKDNDKAVSLARDFARRGYVTASIDYRLLNTDDGEGEPCGGPECPQAIAAVAAQHDAQAAIRFLRRNAATYGIDPQRVAIAGTSAGAGTALLVAVNEEDPGQSGHLRFPSGVSAAISISGAIPPHQRSTFRPLLDPDDAPTFFFYGTEDAKVVPESVAATVADMNEFGGGAFSMASGVGHVPFTPEAQAIYKTQGNYFFYYELDLAHAAR
jgi:acetyl esterase/lipase